ncbi:MAG TPA: Na+/H+ antiporter NhaA [Dehalococcoidia bacterium]|nr:Na+/H+ antiporter NhaA [Dehalococcoidia bacterium]
MEIFQPPWRAGEGRFPRYVVQPTIQFMRVEAAGGIAIVLFAVVALVWVNIDPHSYESFWGTEIVFDFDILTLAEPLEGWVNDALMVIFFFVVGLEIKREAIHGELADRKAATLPIVAAAGGMIVPALIFTVINLGGDGGAGWGIPVATDIAFAIGVLALLGRRVPIQLKIFLLALAVADDIGGILIIAVFYTDSLELGWLAAAGGFIALLFLMQRIGVRSIPAYIVVGLALWLATFESGIEATIAGVVLGLITPVASLYGGETLPLGLGQRLDNVRAAVLHEEEHRREDEMRVAVGEIEELARESASPLERVEHFLSPWSAFVIIPVFALANAGVELSGDVLEEAVQSSVAWGVAAGLILGKFFGVLIFSFIAVRTGIAVMPRSFGWPEFAGVSLLAGIGFTVAIFIAGLAYDEELLVEEAKIGILFASVLAAILGYIGLRIALNRRAALTDALVAEEALLAED